MKIVRFLTTVLGGLAVCALLLACVGYRVGTDVPPAERWDGLTAATVLASDGMSAKGGRTDDARMVARADRVAAQGQALDRAALRRLAGAAVADSGATKPEG